MPALFSTPSIAAAAAQQSASTAEPHRYRYQSWESQLICLFIILGFVMMYTLATCLYEWHTQTTRVGTNRFEGIDQFLAKISSTTRPQVPGS